MIRGIQFSVLSSANITDRPLGTGRNASRTRLCFGHIAVLICAAPGMRPVFAEPLAKLVLLKNCCQVPVR